MKCVEALERRIREQHPEIISLFVKPQTSRSFHAAGAARFGSFGPV